MGEDLRNPKTYAQGRLPPYAEGLHAR